MAKKKRVPVLAGPDAVKAALRGAEGGCRLVLHVKPNSKVEGLDADAAGLVLRIAAPPVEGQANDRVLEVLAALLDVARRDLELVRGQSARHKEVAILGLDAEAALARILGS